MRGLRAKTISILAIGQLVASAAGVTAQDEAPDPMAPATFEVWFTGPPEEESEYTWTETPFGEAYRGVGIVDVPFEAGDSRASGLFTRIGNENVLGDLLAISGRVRIVNADGAWEGPSSGYRRKVDEPTAKQAYDRAAWIATLSGEGDYDGLTLVLTRTRSEFQGYIIPTDLLPPVPDLPAE